MCGNATIAAQKAGYSNHSAAQIGCRLKNQFKDEIDKILYVVSPFGTISTTI